MVCYRMTMFDEFGCTLAHFFPPTLEKKLYLQRCACLEPQTDGSASCDSVARSILIFWSFLFEFERLPSSQWSGSPWICRRSMKSIRKVLRCHTGLFPTQYAVAVWERLDAMRASQILFNCSVKMSWNSKETSVFCRSMLEKQRTSPSSSAFIA